MSSNLKKNPRISIIVPVYNMAQYLRKCLNSLINQTYKDFEIIIINDGSTDNSLDICNEYKVIDQRIKITSHSNKGLSGALNTGLENARGEWLMFVDSDDWIELDTLEELHNMITKHTQVDLIRSFNREVDEKGHFIVESIQKEEQLYTRDEFLQSNLTGGFISSLFVRRSIVEINNLKFDTDLTIKMDLVFTWYCILCCDNILVNYKVFYNYFIRETSLIRSQSFKKIMDNLLVGELVYSYAKNAKINQKIVMSTVYTYLNNQLCDFILGLVNIYQSEGLIKSSDQIRTTLYGFVKKTSFSLYKMNLRTFSLFILAIIDYRIIAVMRKNKNI